MTLLACVRHTGHSGGGLAVISAAQSLQAQRWPHGTNRQLDGASMQTTHSLLVCSCVHSRPAHDLRAQRCCTVQPPHTCSTWGAADDVPARSACPEDTCAGVKLQRAGASGG